MISVVHTQIERCLTKTNIYVLVLKLQLKRPLELWDISWACAKSKLKQWTKNTHTNTRNTCADIRLVRSLYVSGQNKANHYNNDNICHDCDFLSSYVYTRNQFFFSSFLQLQRFIACKNYRRDAIVYIYIEEM